MYCLLFVHVYSLKVSIINCVKHCSLLIHNFCSASRHYKLAMHVFGLMTSATTLRELDEVVLSAAVVFSSEDSGPNLEKHFHSLQEKLCTMGTHLKEEQIVPEDFLVSFLEFKFLSYLKNNNNA